MRFLNKINRKVTIALKSIMKSSDNSLSHLAIKDFNPLTDLRKKPN